MGVPEAEVRMVEGTYEETKGRVVCEPGIMEEFRVDGECPKPNIIHCSSGGDQQESKYSTRDILRKLLNADDLAQVGSNSGQ